jgi:hypothetical protein
MSEPEASTIRIQCDRFSDILVLLPKIQGRTHFCGKLPTGLSHFSNIRGEWMNWFDELDENSFCINGLKQEKSLDGRITASSQIQTAVDSIIAACNAKNRVYPDYLDHLRLVSYELLQNAVFCAPIDPSTKLPKYLNLARGESVALNEQESPAYVFHESDDICAIGVRDSFGRLEKKRIVKTLAEAHTYGVRDASSRDQSQGAGIGLHMILTLADHSMIRVLPNKSTEIVCFFWKYRRRALQEERVQSLSLFLP